MEEMTGEDAGEEFVETGNGITWTGRSRPSVTWVEAPLAEVNGLNNEEARRRGR